MGSSNFSGECFPEEGYADGDKCDSGEQYPNQMMQKKNPRYVPTYRRKALMGICINIAEEVEKVKDYNERQCLLRMLETLINECR
jgi:hypothetical protein